MNIIETEAFWLGVRQGITFMIVFGLIAYAAGYAIWLGCEDTRAVRKWDKERKKNSLSGVED